MNLSKMKRRFSFVKSSPCNTTPHEVRVKIPLFVVPFQLLCAGAGFLYNKVVQIHVLSCYVMITKVGSCELICTSSVEKVAIEMFKKHSIYLSF